MDNYKAQTTLNEKDSLMDLLNAEKSLVNVYSQMLTEGVSKGFRDTVKDSLEQAIESQFEVFMLLTELGYARVCSAEYEELNKTREKYRQIMDTLS